MCLCLRKRGGRVLLAGAAVCGEGEGGEDVAFTTRSQCFPEIAGGTAEGRTLLGGDIASGVFQKGKNLKDIQRWRQSP